MPVERMPLVSGTGATPGRSRVGSAGEVATNLPGGGRLDLPAEFDAVHRSSAPQSAPAQAPTSRPADLLALAGCNAIVFVASLCTMILELTASRLIASYVGNSLYTWTSVIGVVLAGISIGNFIGGWLADRFPPRKVIAGLFLASGLLTFSVLPVNSLAATAVRPDGVNWPLWVMLVVAWVFFIPAVSLGTISPVTASMALARRNKTGITVGNIYAWGAVGSIVGTFLTGFWLIGEFGSRQVICMTAGALVLMAVLVAGGQRLFRVAALVGALPFIIHYGLISSTSAEQLSQALRGIAGARSLWSTTPADFQADEDAIEAAAQARDRAALASARERHDWREARLRSEESWGRFGAKLGGQLHALGMTLALRSDDPAQYHDESDYFAVSVATRRSGDEVVKALSLDHLIHSYYNPREPARLYYEYEQIYAAVTERAARQWDRRSAVELARPPGAELVAAFPPAVAYDDGTRALSIRGPMDFGQFRSLLSNGPQAELWEALFSVWEQSSGDWSQARHKIGNAIVVPIRALPRGLTFPAGLETRVRYDAGLKSLVCTAPFTFDELLGIMSQGERQDYVAAVRKLYFQSRTTSTLFIGGGGYIFPRWIEATFPGEPVIDVAEIDPAVQTAAETELGQPREYGSPAAGRTYIRTHIGDARNFVDDRLRGNQRLVAGGQAPATYDFIYGDAFNDLSVPWHLTTLEFNTKVRELLTPDEGVYLINLIDIYPRAEYPPASEKPAHAEATLENELPAPLFTTRLPAEIEPEEPQYGVWQPTPAPFAGLQTLRYGDHGWQLGFRGLMSDALRERLLALAPRDVRWTDAVRSLDRDSHAAPTGQFLARYLNTARSVFPHVYVFTSHKGEPRAARDTFVVVCSLKDLQFDDPQFASGFWKQSPFACTTTGADGNAHDRGDMPALLQLARGHLLTDDFAPVDNLLMPVAAIGTRQAAAP